MIFGGFTSTFSTKGKPLAGGVDLTLKCPRSWKPVSDPAFTCVQMWRSDGGHGKDTFSIRVDELDEVPTAQERDAFFELESLNDEFSAEGMTVLDVTRARVDGMPGGTFRAVCKLPVGAPTMESRGVGTFFVWEDKLIILQINSYPPKGEKISHDHAARMARLLRVIASSVILHAQPTEE
jgi:hypothetical protein